MGLRHHEPDTSPTSAITIFSTVLDRAKAMTLEEREEYFAFLGLANAYQSGQARRRYLLFGEWWTWRERIQRRISAMNTKERERLERSNAQYEPTSWTVKASPRSQSVGNMPALQSSDETGAATRVRRFHRVSFALLVIASLWSASALLPNLYGSSEAATPVTFWLEDTQDVTVSLTGVPVSNMHLSVAPMPRSFSGIVQGDAGRSDWRHCAPDVRGGYYLEPWMACGWRGFGWSRGAGEHVVQFPGIEFPLKESESFHRTYVFQAAISRSDIRWVTPPAQETATEDFVTLTWTDPPHPPSLAFTSTTEKRDAQAAATLLTLVLGFLLAGVFQVLPDLLRGAPARNPTVLTMVRGGIAASALALPYLANAGLVRSGPLEVPELQLLALGVIGILVLGQSIAGRLAKQRWWTSAISHGRLWQHDPLLHRALPDGTRGHVHETKHRRVIGPVALPDVALLVAGTACAGAAAIIEAWTLPLSHWLRDSPGLMVLFAAVAAVRQVIRIILLLFLAHLFEPYVRWRVAIPLAATLAAMSEHGSVAPMGMFASGAVEIHQPSMLTTILLSAALMAAAYVWKSRRRPGQTMLIWGGTSLLLTIFLLVTR